MSINIPISSSTSAPIPTSTISTIALTETQVNNGGGSGGGGISGGAIAGIIVGVIILLSAVAILIYRSRTPTTMGPRSMKPILPQYEAQPYLPRYTGPAFVPNVQQVNYPPATYSVSRGGNYVPRVGVPQPPAKGVRFGDVGVRRF